MVKSIRAENYIEDLQETFTELRKNNMRLNSAECAFRLTSGMFLGFMITRWA